jgi:hypothetical protein
VGAVPAVIRGPGVFDMKARLYERDRSLAATLGIERGFGAPRGPQSADRQFSLVNAVLLT